MNRLQQTLRDLYLEYLNDFLTINYMSSVKEIPEPLLRAMVDEGRKIYNEEVEMWKAKQMLKEAHENQS